MTSGLQRMERECLALQTAMTARAVARVYGATMRSLGVPTTQFHLLGALALHPEAGMAELAELLVLDRSTLVRNLKLLERNRLIESERPAGSRAKRFALTASGRAVIEAAVPIWEEAHGRLVSALGEEGLADARAALERLRTAARDAGPTQD
ncbi:MarR family transcriptional regulator [Thalassobaculum fulvum]|uniref:MarR family transcriptional regulator n=1 Tax=Thalassobaculum fulvum TaxID=1633335 RepID=A0A918XVM3_9PROT|nr:MarR family winged helix-turn-helix transcriptional regulator [Thalassobaculum fulvum]GHD57019.1 MarR family transcriptional regulator [Thalassobaculum fulvum]